MAITRKLIMTVSILAGFSALASAQGPDLAGFDHLEIKADHRAGLIQGSIWYPAGGKGAYGIAGDNAVFKGERVQQGAPVRNGQFPLVVLSHGSGGNVGVMAWLAQSLTEAGYIVAGVNHPGSTTGNASPRRAVRHWQRAQDVSALLDHLSEDRSFSQHVKLDQVSVLGFSLGGSTALSLGGMRLDLDLYQDYCARYRERAADCAFFWSGGVDLSKLNQASFEARYRDPRIGKVIAVDPGLAYGAEPASVLEMDLPVLLINLGMGKDRLLAADSGPEGNGLSVKLPQVRFVELPNANHFTFLAVCKPGGAQLLADEGEDPICDDPAGANRAEKHQLIEREILQFLNS